MNIMAAVNANKKVILIHSLQLNSHELIINLQAAESVAAVRAARVLFMCILI